MPSDLRLSPNIILEVWDFNESITSSDTAVASLRLSLDSAQVSNALTDLLKPPEWLHLRGMDGKLHDMGEILISYQVIPRNEIKTIPKSPDISPMTRRAWLDCHIVGLRNLKKIGTFPIYRPYLTLSIFDANTGKILTGQTSTSRQPTTSDPNFLDRQSIDINLPEDPLYTPALEVSADISIFASFRLVKYSLLFYSLGFYMGQGTIQPIEAAGKYRCETK